MELTDYGAKEFKQADKRPLGDRDLLTAVELLVASTSAVLATAKELPETYLRDYFAGQAMAAFIANPNRPERLDGTPPAALLGLFSRAAYEMADAMLEARKAKP